MKDGGASLTPFLERLFREGMAVMRERPRLDRSERTALQQLLETAFDACRLDVAGSPIDFDARTALAAAEVLGSACWFLVSSDELEEEVVRSVKMPGRPGTPAQHLSADLLFRYLPQVHSRARAAAASDALTRQLARLLRDWPLSGVLSDVSEGPDEPPDFCGHLGLQMLYAERLARNEKPAWAPAPSARDRTEWVFSRMEKRMAGGEE